MKELFPRNQVIGFIFSIVLTVVALLVYFWDLSFSTGIMILLITALAQAGLQLVVFMHAGETKDKTAIYTNVFYGIVIAIVTILGTMVTLHWDMM